MENFAKKEGSTWTIYYNNEIFGSIIDFSDAYGLSTSTVQKQFASGKTPDQVIQAKKTTHKKVPMKATAKQYPCTVDDVEYPSMSAAASSLGIPLYWLYAFKKKHNYDAQTAVQEAVKIYTPERGNQNSDKQKPCIVDGVEYSSRTAACKAYDVPLVSVYSRRDREDISFEEALSFINREKKRLRASQPKARNLSLSPIKRENIKDDNHIVHRIIKAFEEKNYDFQCLQNASGELVLKVKEQLHSNSQPFEVYIILPVIYREAYIIVEFFAPRLIQIPEGVDKDAVIAQTLYINQEHLMVNTAYDEMNRTITVTGSQVTKQKSQTDGSIVPALFYFLSGCEDILLELQDWLSGV